MIALALIASLALGHVAPPAARRGPMESVRTDSSYASLVARARQAFEARAWNDAAELWRSALMENDAVGEHWVRMAESMYRAERYREAVSAYLRAIQLGAVPADEGALDVARAYAQLGNAKQSARWTELALRARSARSPREAAGEGRSFARSSQV